VTQPIAGRDGEDHAARQLIVMLKRNMYKFIPVFCLFYVGLAIFVFMKFFYYEEIEIIYTLTVPVLIFAPLLLGAFKDVSLKRINLYALVGFFIGFMQYGIFNDVNIWPISMMLWLFLSVPSIAGLNFASISIRKSNEA
jgi:hypothetical protein